MARNLGQVGFFNSFLLMNFGTGDNQDVDAFIVPPVNISRMSLSLMLMSCFVFLLF